MQIIKIGWSYKTAPIDFRDRVALSDESAKLLLKRALDTFEHIREATVMTTCNRMEYYVLTSSPETLKR